jgi:cytoskeletal protein RodZ
VELVDHSDGTALPPTFGASLRAARLRRNITLDAIAAHTKINRAFFQDLEKNDLSKWPASQFYRENYLRAYAEAIGLDPRDVIDGFRRELAATEASNGAVPSARPRRLTPVTIPIILAVTFVVFYALARWVAPSPQRPAAADAPEKPPVAVASPPTAAVPAAPTESATVPTPETPPAVPEHIEGTLTITSTPSGATVLVNGINRGTSPVQVQYLPPGSYTVRFIYPGHTSVTQRATISAQRRQVQVSATLEPPQPPPAAPATE